VVAAVAPDDGERADLRREQMASDRAKARQNRLTNMAGLNEGDRVWLNRPIRNRVKQPMYYLNRRGLPGPAKMIVIRVDRLAPYLEATRDEQP
jgi:hypothetical protein